MFLSKLGVLVTDNKKRRKPTGTTGPIVCGPDGIYRKAVEFPEEKDEIELFIAKGFCKDVLGCRPHYKRYGKFSGLQQNGENSIDFCVDTGIAKRWLELCEFAPLNEFKGSYANVSNNWDAGLLLKLAIALIQKSI